MTLTMGAISQSSTAARIAGKCVHRARPSKSGKASNSRSERRILCPIAAVSDGRSTDELSRRAIVQASGLSLLLGGVGSRVAFADEAAMEPVDTKAWRSQLNAHVFGHGARPFGDGNADVPNDRHAFVCRFTLIFPSMASQKAEW